MANKAITGYAEGTVIDDADYILGVDVSDTSSSVNGTTKKFKRATVVAGITAAPAPVVVSTPPSIPPAATAKSYRGVSASGLEFSGIFQANSAALYNYIGRKGFNVVRIPFEWYELQPTLNAPLDTVSLGYLQNEVNWAKAAGLNIILDMHNYARRYVYRNGGFTDDFASTTQRTFRMPYGDHDAAAATISVRDYGRAIAGTLANPLTPATSYVFSLTFKINTNPNTSDELFLEVYRTDDNNEYALVINPSLGTWRLQQVIAGVVTVLASGSKTWTLGVNYACIIDVGQATTGRINVSIDGTPLFPTNSVSTTSSLTSGYVGVYGTAMNVTIKSVTLNVATDTTSGGPAEYRVTDTLLPMSAWNDFWRRLSTVFKDEPAILGYDQNEPYSMPVPTSTTNYSQAAATANAVPLATVTNMYQNMLNTIRANGDTKYIFVEWDSYSNLHRFTEFFGSNPDPWVIDSLTTPKVAYSAHYYFDSDHSGSYSVLTVPSTATITSEATPALSWAKSKGVPLLIGEIGWPADSSWDAVATFFYNLCDQYSAWVTYWAAGDVYSSITTIQPTSSYTVDAQQMAIVASHLGTTTPVTINDLKNVKITSPNNNDLLAYNATLLTWVNVASIVLAGLDVNSDSITVRTAKTPATAASTGIQGQIAWDTSYIYICTATNTWKRVAILTW